MPNYLTFIKLKLKIDSPDLECLIYKDMGKMRKLLFLVPAHILNLQVSKPPKRAQK